MHFKPPQKRLTNVFEHLYLVIKSLVAKPICNLTHRIMRRTYTYTSTYTYASLALPIGLAAVETVRNAAHLTRMKYHLMVFAFFYMQFVRKYRVVSGNSHVLFVVKSNSFSSTLVHFFVFFLCLFSLSLLLWLFYLAAPLNVWFGLTRFNLTWRPRNLQFDWQTTIKGRLFNWHKTFKHLVNLHMERSEINLNCGCFQ